jgi:PKD repeat protein
VDPAPFSPNLDIRASLFDVSGTLLASSNPADSLPAALSGTLVAGEYFLEVDGTGKGDPLGTGYSDYASLGRYTVSAAVPDPGGLAAPVAMITANYTPDYATVLVGFDSVGSNDSDGSIVSFDWQFGDGNSGSGAAWDHPYTAPGTYLATLTVTDNEGLQGSDSISVEVHNRAPVAVASADESSGMAPFPVVFSSAGSNDPDDPEASGFIASYAWDFGDGTSSSDPNPSHTYNTDGLITATLVVTDNLGATGAANVQLDITPSPITHQSAYGEQLVAGTVTGNYTLTHAENDNSWQKIGERESGGRKTTRHSYLEHIWLFEVRAANEVTLDLIAQQSGSSDNDVMKFSYSVNNGIYHPIVTLEATPVTISGFALSEAQFGGTVRIRVVDSDREPGNRSLDTVSVNLLHILSNNEGGPNDPPSGVPQLNSAEATSSSAITLQWSYAGSDASGFRIERSTGGADWSSTGTVAANQLTYTDSGLAAATDYDYLVVPFNSVDDGSASNMASARTDDASAIVLQASGRKVKGVQKADLSWTGSNDVDIYSGGSYHDSVSGASQYTDDIGKKGGGSYTYQVCDKVSSDCSTEVTVVF